MAGSKAILQRGLVALAFVASLALLFGPGLLEHMQNAANPYRFNNDARMQIPPLLRYWDPELRLEGYISDYFLEVMLPTGYRLLYAVLAQAFDPRAVSKVLPYGLYACMLAAVGASAYRLGGVAAAWCSVALCMGADLYLGGMAGGLPRAFGRPLVALLALGLAWGRIGPMVAATLIGSVFYFSVAAISGLALAAYLLLVPAAWREGAREWSRRRRVAVVAVTGLVSLALVLPTVLDAQAYGPALDQDQVEQYPEVGPGGRYAEQALPASQSLPSAKALSAAAKLPLRAVWARRAQERGEALGPEALHDLARGSRTPLGIAVVALTVIGALRMRDSPVLRRLLLLPGAGVALYFAAHLFSPHLFFPFRAVAYTLPMATGILLPAGLLAIARRALAGRATQHAPAATVVGLCLLLVLSLGGRNASSGLNAYDESERPVYEFIASLPADALVAGGPGELLDNIPLLSARGVLVSFEVHHVFHEAYAREMRRRMTAVIEALYASDTAPLLQLRDAFGVSHFVVDQRFYQGTPPRYFEPFDAMIAEAASRSEAPAVLRTAADSVVFRHGDYLVLALDRIAPAAHRDPDRQPGASHQPGPGSRERPAETAVSARPKQP